MTARAFGALTLAVSVGLASPWLGGGQPEAPAPMTAATLATPASPQARLRTAVETAVRQNIPGAAASDWTPDRLDLSDSDPAGMQHLVATGTLATPGAPETRVRLSGRYDGSAGTLSRISYRLLPGGHLAPDRTVSAPAWSLQDAVEQSLAQAHPESTVRFALDSAQASRLERGGRRFEGFGLAVMDGDTRFVAFTLDLSAQGQSLAFDFGPEEFVAEPELGLAARAE